MEVEMTIRGLMMDPVSNMPIVILKDIGGDTVLPIWVGVYEANAIALEIEKVWNAVVNAIWGAINAAISGAINSAFPIPKLPSAAPAG